VVALLHDLRDLVRDGLHAHPRLQVVRRDLGRRDHVPLLVVELRLDAAVEEERDVRVFLGFCVRGCVSCFSAFARGFGSKSENKTRGKKTRKYPPAICACFTPFVASHSASTFVMPCGGNATEKGNSLL
jgi:hypothetical protein